MKKAAIILIVLAGVIVIGVNWFLSSLTEPLPPAERDDTTLRSTESGEVVGFIDTFGARAFCRCSSIVGDSNTSLAAIMATKASCSWLGIVSSHVLMAQQYNKTAVSCIAWSGE